MKRLIMVFVLAATTSSCRGADVPYLERVRGAKYKVGDVITVNEGTYKGCHLKVERVEPTNSGIRYMGTSPDCPIKGVAADGVYGDR